MVLPRSISKLIENFEKLPGIGPKTAQRLAFYLLHFPYEDLVNFADSLTSLKIDTKICSICKNVAEEEQCSICRDASRDHNVIAVVASSLDVFALEKTGYRGVYHVLHGVINPLNNIGPNDIFINELIPRLKELEKESIGDDAEKPVGKIAEVVLATNTSMEGESTALYITKLIRDSGLDKNRVKITRIARGLPVGGDIEYADDITLSRALEGRNEISS